MTWWQIALILWGPVSVPAALVIGPWLKRCREAREAQPAGMDRSGDTRMAGL